MIRMSRIGMIAVLLMALLLVACDQNVDDVLDNPESTTPSGEVIVGTETAAPGENGVAAAGEDSTATAPSAEGEGSPTGSEGVDSGGGLGTGAEGGAEATAGAEAPSTPAAEDNSGTALMTPEPEETTVSIGATPEITPTASTGDVAPAAEATPEPAPTPTTYTVVAGDTLFSIAQRHNTTVDELIALNPGLSPNFIFIGQQITVPGQPGTAPAPAPEAGGQRIHTVQAGEWLYAIARQYNVSPEAIMLANNLATPDVIQPGQQLIIPNQ